jgi:hypothetical protein
LRQAVEVDFLEKRGDLLFRAPCYGVGHVHAGILHMTGGVDRWAWADGYTKKRSRKVAFFSGFSVSTEASSSTTRLHYQGR